MTDPMKRTNCFVVANKSTNDLENMFNQEEVEVVVLVEEVVVEVEVFVEVMVVVV